LAETVELAQDLVQWLALVVVLSNIQEMVLVFSGRAFKLTSLTVSGYNEFGMNELGIHWRIILKWILGQ
jgi:hypothetical protein